MPERADRLAAVPRPPGLRAVLDQDQAALVGKDFEGVHVTRVAGQMDGDELDTIFRSFKEGKADILVATSIVENGIDIPNANTILIDRAEQFGLADLYQLKGRVGRSHRPGYAYFLTKSHERLQELSRKRLQALVEASGYGGGMKIAPRAKLDDGLLDLCIIRAINSFKLFCLFPTIYFGKHLSTPEVEYLQTARLQIQTQAPLDVYADGEYVCQTPVEVNVLPSALTVITP